MVKRKKAPAKSQGRAEQTYLSIIVGVFVLAVFVVLMAISVGTPLTFSQKQALTGAQLTESAVKQASQPTAIKVTLSYVGEIQTIDKKGFSILALAEKNKLQQDKVIEIKVTPQTIYQQSIKNKPAEEIDFQDLKEGDLVVAFSNNDVTNLLAMEAITVQKVR